MPTTLHIDELLRKVREHGASLNHDHTDAFILGLPENYLNEDDQAQYNQLKAYLDELQVEYKENKA